MTNVMFPLGELFSIFSQALISRLTGLLEDHKRVLYSERDARVGGQLGRKLKAARENVLIEVTKVHRGAFLWACANAVDGLSHEVMLLGFGQKSGTRNLVTAVQKITGAEHSVSPTQEAWAAITAHLSAGDKNSVLLVHNHPEHILSTALALLLGPEPLPSLRDRNTALSVHIHRLQQRMSGRRCGNIRFYLIQNGEVGEFSGIYISTIVDVLR